MSYMRELTILLMKAQRKEISELEDLVERSKLRIIKPPTQSLIMAVARDSFETEFCLGEILITEATVEYGGFSGYGVIIGNEPLRALILAFIDAVEKSNNEKTKKDMLEILKKIERKVMKRERIEKAMILKTKVEFETMVKR